MNKRFKLLIPIKLCVKNIKESNNFLIKELVFLYYKLLQNKKIKKKWTKGSNI